MTEATQFKYYMFGLRPVKEAIDKEGLTRGMHVMNWDTGELEINNRYLSKMADPFENDVKEITKEEFDKTVKSYKDKAKAKKAPTPSV